MTPWYIQSVVNATLLQVILPVQVSYQPTLHFTPGRWIFSLVCHFNFTGSIQTCNHFWRIELIVHIAIYVLNLCSKSCPSRVVNRTASSDIGKAPPSNHCATSLNGGGRVPAFKMGRGGPPAMSKPDPVAIRLVPILTITLNLIDWFMV